MNVGRTAYSPEFTDFTVDFADSVSWFDLS